MQQLLDFDIAFGRLWCAVDFLEFSLSFSWDKEFNFVSVLNPLFDIFLCFFAVDVSPNFSNQFKVIQFVLIVGL